MTFVINYRTYISENNKVGAKPQNSDCPQNNYFMHILILSTKELAYT